LRAAANVLVLQQWPGLPVHNTWPWLLHKPNRSAASLRAVANVLVLQQWPGLPVENTWYRLLRHPGRGNQSLPEGDNPSSKIALTVYIYGVREKESILL